MKNLVKKAFSCTLAALCAANAVPFASVSAADLSIPSMAYSFAAASDGAFTADDYSAERSTVTKHVEFKINTAEISADELEAMGYTISEDRTVASKDTTLAKITYTFNKLPATADELKNFSMKSDVQGDYDYGMFAPMAATILALHTYGTNKDEAYNMLDYAYGPQTFGTIDKQFVQTQFATAANKVLQDCYFGGAKPENGYTPDEPFTITLEEGPYVIKAKNGKPERHMSFIYFDGADTERYMDVCQSDDGTWYAYESNYKHLLASVKEPVNELPDLPVEEVPESERYYTEKHDTVEKHVEFEINKAMITADELEEMGYTISEDRTTASKDVTLAKITYTFDKLPTTLDELKKFSLKSKIEGDFDYGMFAPMAATILALHAYGTDKEEAYKMLDYVYGPNQTFGNFDKQFVQTQFATAANKVLQDCYFGGAKPENGYTPDEPFTITLEEGPYFIKAANGKPERHMSFIYFDGADSERYMDVFKSSGGTWYGYESNYKHLLASVKEPVSELPDLPVEEVPESERYYTEKHDTVEKHVEFEINKAMITADELEAMGYTISEDRRTASKDVTLAKITYTFDKLPTTLDELKKFSLKSKIEGDYDYGMFAPMAATILALHTYGTDKEEAYKMLDYVYGPNQTFSNLDKQFVQTQFATAANKVLQNCYFGGATPENGYTPDEPFTITLEEGPYFIKASNGKPERHMSFVYFAGADSERYMDVFKSSGGTWYGYDSNYKHLLASVKEPTGTAPATTTAVTTTKSTTTTTKAVTTTAKAATTTAKAATTTAKAATTTAKAVTTTAKAATTTAKAVTTTAKAATTTAKITTTAITSGSTNTTPAQTTTTAPTKPEIVKGDVDGDEKVSIEDVQIALKAYTIRISGKKPDLTDKQLKAADVNENGELSVDDVQNMLIYYVNNTVAGKKLTWEELLGNKPQAQTRPDVYKRKAFTVLR
ncbi:MAG: dockerin type I repeat-containing protein [Oscillospiraceae bacterium]|nr:dockerin type I repeat-containing protein [Oscillospiraceae bacterium]